MGPQPGCPSIHRSDQWWLIEGQGQRSPGQSASLAIHRQLSQKWRYAGTSPTGRARQTNQFLPVENLRLKSASNVTLVPFVSKTLFRCTWLDGKSLKFYESGPKKCSYA